jgi:hypothetical protein
MKISKANFKRSITSYFNRLCKENDCIPDEKKLVAAYKYLDTQMKSLINSANPQALFRKQLKHANTSQKIVDYIQKLSNFKKYKL